MIKKSIFMVLILILCIGIIWIVTHTSNTTSPPLSQSSPSLTKEQANASRVEAIAQNLRVPWDMAFLPDGSMLITERQGRVRLLTKDGKLQDEPILVLTNVRQTGESGLQGIALHPDFEKNHFVYLYYTYDEPSANTLNRVSRFTYENGKLSQEKIIVDSIPGAANHDGGRIRFGPDTYLYITTGDAQEPSLAQNTDTLAGKILRVTDTGDPAPHNPFNNRIFSYGHRNPQGITWNESGVLYATEHGRSGALSGLDELNKIEAGKNYGWPTIQGDETHEGMVSPILNSGLNTTWAPSGAAYYNGAVYFVGLRGQSLYKATLRQNSVDLTSYFSHEFGRLRNVIVGPDGLLYISTSNYDGRGTPKENDDKILRVNPAKL